METDLILLLAVVAGLLFGCAVELVLERMSR